MTLPCGTPLMTLQGVDEDDPTLTCWRRLERNAEIQ